MDFGLFFLMQRDEKWSEHDVYDSGLRQMLAAESQGYHSVWIAEHHFNDYGLCPAPTVLASYVAARTTTLRLGMGVSLLPLHHPVDLAEQLAVLDVVSGGRLDVGIGRGGTLQDYQTFQSDRSDSRKRVEEGIALMQQCWSGRPFERDMERDYLKQLNEAYNHFFFHYVDAPLLVVNTNAIDFVNNPDDFEDLLKRIVSHRQGTVYYAPIERGHTP